MFYRGKAEIIIGDPLLLIDKLFYSSCRIFYN